MAAAILTALLSSLIKTTGLAQRLVTTTQVLTVDAPPKPPMQPNITGHEDVPASNEEALLKAIANQ